jgi:endonuclease/exonuclease/phosphatase family metal-dependent hydrolase
LETDHGRLNILNTHLALKPQDRQVQIRRLLDDDWLGGLSSDEAVIFCGDLNAGFRSPVYRALLSKYADVQMQIGQRGYPQHTFFSFYPFLRLDHIFISLHLTTLRVRVYQSVEARLASDHLPLCARLKWADSG